MRETFRLNRGRFPEKGDLLFMLKRTDDEQRLISEMYQLSDKLMRTAEKENVPRGTLLTKTESETKSVPRGTLTPKQ